MTLLTLPASQNLTDLCNPPRGNMKRFLLLTPILFVLVTTGALADSVSIGYAPNEGTGDNFGFLVTAPGLSVSGGGGTPVDFFGCCFPPGYLPGSTLGGSTDIFFSGGSATIGGISYDVSFGVGSLFMSTIVLPTNGQDYRAPVEISFFASGIVDALQSPISVSGSANGYIDFSYSAFAGSYFPDLGGFVPVPEPGTLGLTGTGLIGILALVLNGIKGWSHARVGGGPVRAGERPMQPCKLKLV